MAAEVIIDVIAKDSYSSVLGNFGNIITGIKSALDLARDAFEFIAAPVIEFGTESILAAARVSELSVVNAILAENAGILASQIPPLVEGIRAQGIEAAIAEGVIASFIDAQLDLTKAVDLTRIAQDAAVVSGMNSSDTLDNIIYGITTLNPLVLRHAGIIVDLQLEYKEWAEENDRTVDSLTTAEKQTIALNAVLEAGTGIAGAYAAAMEEPGKVLRSFPRYFDDIMVAIGEPFQEAFGNVVFALADVAKWVGKAVSEGGLFRPMLEEWGAALANFTQTAAENIKGFLAAMNSDDPVGALDGFFAGLINTLTAQVYTWINTGGPQLLTNQIFAFIEDIGGDSDSATQAKFVTAAQNLLTALATAIGEVDWLGITDAMDVELAEGIERHDWTASGNAFGEAVAGFDSGIQSQNSVAIQAIGQAISDWLLGAMGIVNWDEFGSTLGYAITNGISNAVRGVGEGFWTMFADQLFGEDLDTFFAGARIGAERIGEGLKTIWYWVSVGIGEAIIDGVIDGWTHITWDAGIWIKEHIIDPVKNVLGISSPSTVFAGIGRNIVLGLISGWTSAFGSFLNIVQNAIASIMDLFDPIWDALGIGGTGSTSGGRDMGGTTTTSTGGTIGGGSMGGTGTGSGVVYNFYGPAYFNSAGPDPNGYDCPSPHPLLTASSQTLTTSGIG